MGCCDPQRPLKTSEVLAARFLATPPSAPSGVSSLPRTSRSRPRRNNPRTRSGTNFGRPRRVPGWVVQPGATISVPATQSRHAQRRRFKTGRICMPAVPIAPGASCAQITHSTRLSKHLEHLLTILNNFGRLVVDFCTHESAGAVPRFSLQVVTPRSDDPLASNLARTTHHNLNF